jgi:hypothetical protein
VREIGVKVAGLLTSHKKIHDIVYRAHNRLYISQVLTTYLPPLLVITMIEDAWEDVSLPQDRSAQDSVASLLKRIKKLRCSQVLSMFGPMASFLLHYGPPGKSALEPLR